ncbi:BTAD domain-containing putative transcriptional regulator [Actinomadura fulvescens]
MRFGVLGPLEVWTEGGERVRVPDLKVRALLADLLAHRGRAVPADRLIDDLWGDRLPANPAATLQARVSQLRKVLAGAEGTARGLVESRAPGYALRVEPDAVDAGRFEELVERARRTGDPGLWDEALALWRGDAYADFGDAEFARTEIDRLEELRLTAIEEWSETGSGTAFGAADLAALVAAHPLRERLRAAHMRALYRAGRQGEALASFQDFRERLRDELGLDPGPELVALQRSILDHKTRARTRAGLPAPVNELVGRAGAVRDVRALLGKARLVTLTGPGGVGKTRLAVESARGLEAEYADGVRLVELTALGASSADASSADAPSVDALSVDDVASAVTAGLGLRDEAAVRSSPVHRLLDALAGRRTLLILDNCEHVIEPVAALAARLLPAAPELRLLATSQEPLGIAGELVWSVPPLETSSAVELFVTRAAAAAPGFAPGPGDAEAVAAICRRLDGLPLALELAATRVRAMDVTELADRLHDRFRLLSAGRRDAPARQRTLRAMIDWSWEPLAGPERAVLRRLSVHAGGCTLEAAEQVCAGGGIEPGEVLGLLARLVDRSLVVRADGRYRLLESVAAYCAERLDEAGERAAVLGRRDRYYTELAERAGPHLRGRDQRRWLERLNAETANLRAVLRESAPGLASRLANALAWHWFLSGRLDEARRTLGSVLSREGVPASERARASAWLAGFTMLEGEGADRADRTALTERALDGLDDGRAEAEWFLGFARTGFGDVPEIEKLLTRALAGFRAQGDRWGQAAVLVTRAGQAMARGELAAVSRDGEHAMALFREAGDRWGMLQATEVLGVLAEAVGDYERAARLHRDGLAMAEELGSYAEVSYKLSRLGRIALLTGDHAEAAELHERARRIAAERSHQRMEQFAETGLALVARRRGDLDTAERYLRRWLGWIRDVDGAPGLALVLAELGFAAEQRGDARTAADLHAEGLAAARSTGNPRAVALALEGLAGAAALDGRPAEAARLLGEATAARAAAGAPLPQAERGDVDRITAAVRSALGDAAFDDAFTSGLASGRTPSATR